MIALANDHSGIALKEEIKKLLDKRGLEYKDFGTNTEASVDYPIYGESVAKAVVSGECDRGIIICGTGIGISIAANKVRGARVLGHGLALKIVETFLDTEFEGGRHARRVDIISAIEERSR